ncbi:MAG: SufS family cysteine desulfurase [Deltaproteobacteria bacterium]|nr:SufS family cysteine desulfurase [Deltaproteobacteria bacterium]
MTTGAFDVEALRDGFPALRQQVRGRPLAYLDSAATALKPTAVIDALTGYYTRDSANVHRGVHLLSQRASLAYEDAREKVRAFLNASEAREIVFLRGVTEAMNLLAQTLGRARLGPGDEVLVTELEHHSNLVPWQMAAAAAGARVVGAPVEDDGAMTAARVIERIGSRTRIVAVAHASNVLGTVLPVAEIAAAAHARGAIVVVDGAQGAPHLPVDVRALGADFYAFSGHKLFGPTGIGALYGRADLLGALPPWQGGGGMIETVEIESSTYRGLPERFEAGTPHIAGAVGLGAAIDWLCGLDRAAAAAHEDALLARATAGLSRIPGVRLLGTAPSKVSVLSFVLDGVHPHDLGTLLDGEGIAIRAGHHCAQPLMRRYGVTATARASFALYNTTAEVDALVGAVGRARELFG